MCVITQCCFGRKKKALNAKLCSSCSRSALVSSELILARLFLRSWFTPSRIYLSVLDEGGCGQRWLTNLVSISFDSGFQEGAPVANSVGYST